jgi:hypothetical protein
MNRAARKQMTASVSASFSMATPNHFDWTANGGQGFGFLPRLVPPLFAAHVRHLIISIN